MQGSHLVIQLILTSALVIATLTSSDGTSGRREERRKGRFIALDWQQKGLPFLIALLSPKDEDLHVNENSRKRKICLSYGASVRKGRLRVAGGESGLREILRWLATEHLHLLFLSHSPSAEGSMSGICSTQSLLLKDGTSTCTGARRLAVCGQSGGGDTTGRASTPAEMRGRRRTTNTPEKYFTPKQRCRPIPLIPPMQRFGDFDLEKQKV